MLPEHTNRTVRCHTNRSVTLSSCRHFQDRFLTTNTERNGKIKWAFVSQGFCSSSFPGCLHRTIRIRIRIAAAALPLKFGGGGRHSRRTKRGIHKRGIHEKAKIPLFLCSLYRSFVREISRKRLDHGYPFYGDPFGPSRDIDSILFLESEAFLWWLCMVGGHPGARACVCVCVCVRVSSLRSFFLVSLTINFLASHGQEAAQCPPEGCSRKIPLHFVHFIGAFCSNTFFSNTSLFNVCLVAPIGAFFFVPACPPLTAINGY